MELSSDLISEELIPSGWQMAKLPREEQIYWAKRILTTSYLSEDLFKMARSFGKKWYHRYSLEELKKWDLIDDNDTP